MCYLRQIPPIAAGRWQGRFRPTHSTAKLPVQRTLIIFNMFLIFLIHIEETCLLPWLIQLALLVVEELSSLIFLCVIYFLFSKWQHLPTVLFSYMTSVTLTLCVHQQHTHRNVAFKFIQFFSERNLQLGIWYFVMVPCE